MYNPAILFTLRICRCIDLSPLHPAPAGKLIVIVFVIAGTMAVNLSIANMDWEDFTSGFGHKELKKGEVSKPFED